ncbi:hypothetical protein D6827_01700 [Candidatus Parcubacteria bacterium]|nr:MAG: hypothetical protein D6827_01700 [Candidatus Parcubacteria bacterium]
MSKPINSPAAYADVIAIMQRALNDPGLTVEFETPGEAKHFRQRCNSARLLLRKMEAERIAHIPGMRPQIAFDTLVIRLVDATGKAHKDGTIVRFDRNTQFAGVIRTSGGKIISPDFIEKTAEEICGEILAGPPADLDEPQVSLIDPNSIIEGDEE